MTSIGRGNIACPVYFIFRYSCSLVCYKEHQAVTCMERAEAASIKEVLKMSAGPIIKPPAEFGKI